MKCSFPFVVASLVFILSPSSVFGDIELGECETIPKKLCCTQRVLDKCLSGCIDYATKMCPSKLQKFESIGKTVQDDNKIDSNPPPAPKPAPIPVRAQSRPVSYAETPAVETFVEKGDVRRAPLAGDAKLLSQEYPITEVTDADLTSECGTEKSRPPYSPCLSRKSVDDLFLSCCQQHVPANCHSLCTYEHREHVAAETLIAAVQQDGCDLKYMSKVLYCANQNRDNRKCCEFLGMNSGDLGVGDRCLRMCNVAPSGDRVGSIEKSDLVCLSNWNVMMYCARSGLRTIN